MTAHSLESEPPAGPVTDAQLGAPLPKLRLQSSTLAMQENAEPKISSDNGSPDGAITSSLKSAVAARTADDPNQKATEAVCEECRKIFAMKEMARFKEIWVCAACKPNYLQKMGLGSTDHAGLMIRFFAKFLDGVIITLFFLMPFVIHAIWAARDGDLSRFETLPQFLFFGYHIAYVFYSIFFIGRFGATPGKMLCKLKVVTVDGSRVGYGRAIGRFFAELASEALFFSGYIMAAYHEKRYALHDRLCNTVVLYKERAKEPLGLHPQLQKVAGEQQTQSA